MVSYFLIAPILFPKVQKSLREKGINSGILKYAIEYQIQTGSTVQSVYLESGETHTFNGTINPEEVNSDKTGNMLISKILKKYPKAQKIIVLLDKQKKSIDFLYYDDFGKVLNK